MTQMVLPLAEGSGGSAQAGLPSSTTQGWLARNFGWKLILAILGFLATVLLLAFLVFGAASSPTPASKKATTPRPKIERVYHTAHLSVAHLPKGKERIVPHIGHNMWWTVTRGCVEVPIVEKSPLGFHNKTRWTEVCKGDEVSLPYSSVHTFRGGEKGGALAWIICRKGFWAEDPHGCIYREKLPDGRTRWHIQRSNPWPPR